jgi:hypothetical protein
MPHAAWPSSADFGTIGTIEAFDEGVLIPISDARDNTLLGCLGSRYLSRTLCTLYLPELFLILLNNFAILCSQIES